MLSHWEALGIMETEFLKHFKESLSENQLWNEGIPSKTINLDTQETFIGDHGIP